MQHIIAYLGLENVQLSEFFKGSDDHLSLVVNLKVGATAFFGADLEEGAAIFFFTWLSNRVRHYFENAF